MRAAPTLGAGATNMKIHGSDARDLAANTQPRPWNQDDVSSRERRRVHREKMREFRHEPTKIRELEAEFRQEEEKIRDAAREKMRELREVERETRKAARPTKPELVEAES